MVTVHDLAFELIPDAYPPGLLAYLKHVVPVNVRRSRRVAVVSRTTRIDVVERYNINAERVVVIPNAADERFFTAEPLGPSRRAELGVPDDYLLTVGTIEPRKNYANLLAAQAKAYEATKRPLVVVGRKGWQNTAEMKQLGELATSGAAILQLNAQDSDLPGLYAGARTVIYVPRYEGFGLPVLEAMASGAPVITSDIPSVREIAAGFATVVDPEDPDAIADAIRAIEQDSVDLIQERRSAARRYSWTTSGTILTETLHELVASTTT
jgi:alpha-1,3-rhamnosyl/mannosyltransferase